MSLIETLLDSDQKPVIVDEGESHEIDVEFSYKNAAGTKVVIPAGNLATATWTLYDRDADPDAIINSRNAVNILNANNATIEDDIIRVRYDTADNAIGTVSNAGDLEEHVSLFIGTWNDGTTIRTIKKQVIHKVRKIESPV